MVQSLGWKGPFGGGHGNLLHYTCLENSKDGGESMGSQRVEHD